MFEPSSEVVDNDYVRYITHVEASAVERSKRPPTSDDGPRGRRHQRQPRRRPRRDRTAAPTASPKKPLPKQGDKIGRNDRAGAARGGSSSSAMADPKAENALREALGTLEDLEAAGAAAREYLKIDAGRARTRAAERLAADPNLWDDQDRAREVTTELGSA
jgi:hypothetical protein